MTVNEVSEEKNQVDISKLNNGSRNLIKVLNLEF